MTCVFNHRLFWKYKSQLLKIMSAFNLCHFVFIQLITFLPAMLFANVWNTITWGISWKKLHPSIEFPSFHVIAAIFYDQKGSHHGWISNKLSCGYLEAKDDGGGGVVLAGVMADCIVASSTRRVTKARLLIEVLAPSRLNSVPTRIPLPGKRVVTSRYLVTSSRTQMDPCIPGIDLSGAGHCARPSACQTANGASICLALPARPETHQSQASTEGRGHEGPPQQLIEYPCSLDTIGQNLTGRSLLAAGDRWPGDAGDRQGVTPLVPLTAGCRRGHRDHRDTRPVQVTRWSLHATLSPIADTLAISASDKNAIFQSENHL